MTLFRSGRAPQGSHFLQAFFIPQLQIGFVLWTLRDRLTLPWAWYPLFLACLGIVSTFLASWMRRQLLPGWRRFYMGFLVVAFLYVFNGWTLTSGLGLSAQLLIGWGFSLAVTSFSWWLMSQLRGRARLWYYLKPYQGEDLRVHARDYQQDANFTPANRAKLIGLLRLFMAIQIALALWFWDSFSLIRIGFWLMVQVNLEALYRFYRTEMEWLSLGHWIRLDQGVLRLGLVLALSFVALAIALNVTPYIPRYEWNYQTEPQPPAIVTEVAPQPRQNIYNLPVPKLEPPGWVLQLRSWLLINLGRLLDILIRWVIPIILVLMVILPLIHLLQQARWRPRNFWLSLQRRWASFVYFWKNLWALFRKKPPPEPLIFYPSNREIWLQEMKNAPKSKRHRPNNQLVKGFLLLLDVGEDLKVLYHRGMTTRFYLGLLKGVLPHHEKNLDQLSDIMDAGFFRLEPLRTEELETWKKVLFVVLDAARKARHNSEYDHSTKNSQ
jgi:hypothetical protein